jgi:hypothetical protein
MPGHFGAPRGKQILLNALESAIEADTLLPHLPGGRSTPYSDKSDVSALRHTRETAQGFAFLPHCDVRQSPNEIPVALAVRTVSWLGSTRLVSPRACEIGIVTI